MSYYVRHLFFCVNQREDGSRCCANFNSQKMRDYAKAKLKKMHLSGQGKCRANTAGCLDRCDQGPVLVVYPEAVWYTYVDEQDIDEIIEEHIVHSRVVKRLKI